MDKNQYEDGYFPNIVDTMDETDRKCDSCGATMIYDPSKGKLFCEYCGSVRDIETAEKQFLAETDLEKAGDYANHDWGKGTKSVICGSCGAESVYDELQIADVCPYCGSTLVTEAGAPDAMAPGGVCGFRVTVKEASERFTKWIKKRIFAPGIVRKSAKADDFKGVYLPFWTFDSDTYSTYTARYGIDRTVTVNGKRETRTDWYSTRGTYGRFFDDVLIPGTNRYDKDTIRKIKPFDTASAVPYKPEYLAGYFAERYSVGLNDAWKSGRDRISSELEGLITDAIRDEHGADHVESLKVVTEHANVKFKYIMLPVWLSNFKYKEKIYNFMVNGQTGKAGGRYPVAKWKVVLTVLAVLAVIALIVYFKR